MTVLPPSLHPDTGQPYRWTGQPLVKADLHALPHLTKQSLALLRLIVGSEEASVLAEGQSTHEAGVVLAAKLVRFGCSDEEIERIVPALLPSV